MSPNALLVRAMRALAERDDAGTPHDVRERMEVVESAIQLNRSQRDRRRGNPAVHVGVARRRRLRARRHERAHEGGQDDENRKAAHGDRGGGLDPYALQERKVSLPRRRD